MCKRYVHELLLSVWEMSDDDVDKYLATHFTNDEIDRITSQIVHSRDKIITKATAEHYLDNIGLSQLKGAQLKALIRYRRDTLYPPSPVINTRDVVKRELVFFTKREVYLNKIIE